MISAALVEKKGPRLGSLLFATAVVRITATLMLRLQSPMSRSLASGSRIISRVASPSALSCQTPMPVMRTAKAKTTAKPNPRRLPIVIDANIFMCGYWSLDWGGLLWSRFDQAHLFKRIRIPVSKRITAFMG